MNYVTIDKLNELDIEINPRDGDFIYCKRQYTLNNSFDFTGREIISSTADVAFILKNLQEYGVEHSFMCYVLNDNTCIVQQIGIGDFSSCVVNIDILRYTAVKLNAKGVYMAHNHPSGNLNFSRQDRIMHNRCSNSLGNLYQGSIIINTTSGNYAYIKHEADKESISRIPEEELTDIPIQVLQFNKQVFSREYNYLKPFKVTSSDDVAAFISSQKYGARDKAGMLVLNRSMIVMANIQLPFSKINNTTKKELASYMQKCITGMGGTDAVLYFSGNIGKKTMQELKKEFSKISAHNLCDICYNYNGRMKSGLSEGFLNDEKVSDKYKGKSIKI